MACIIVQNKLDNDLIKLMEDNNTLVISKKLENPTYEYIEEIQKSTKYGFEHNINRIYRLLYVAMPRLGANTLKELAQLITDNLPDESNQTILKNYYMQLQKWISNEMYSCIQHIDNNLTSNIVFNRTPGKIELLSLYIMYKLGCNVYIISEVTEKMQNYKELQIKEVNDTIVNKVNTSNKTLDDVYKELINKETITDSVIVGYDDRTELNNFVYHIAEYIRDGNGVIIDQELTNQEYVGIDINKLRNLSRIDFVIAILKDLDWSTNIKGIFTEYTDITFDNNLSTKDINSILKLVLWTNIYIIPNINKLILLYGCKKKKYSDFVNLCRKMPVSTIYVLTDKDELPNGINPTIEFEKSIEVYPLPKFEETSKKSTLAYEATERMTKEVFNGNTLGLYRDYQYSTCMVNTLTSTFDELFIMWDVENMIRPHFQSSNNKLKISTFFTQVLGYDPEYKNQWIKLFKSTDVIVRSYDFWLDSDLSKNRIDGHCLGGRELLIDDNLNYDAVKNCMENPFSNLNSDLEMHMISKIDELIQLNCILDNIQNKNLRLKMCEDIVQACFSIDEKFIELMQSYDFTKRAPKFVVIHDQKDNICKQLAIQIVYLHLLGFDVLVLVPTKYKGIELHVDDRIFHSLVVGDVNFDCVYPKLYEKSKLSGVEKLLYNIGSIMS